MDVDVVLQEECRIDAERGGTALRQGQRGLVTEQHCYLAVRSGRPKPSTARRRSPAHPTSSPDRENMASGDLGALRHLAASRRRDGGRGTPLREWSGYRLLLGDRHHSAWCIPLIRLASEGPDEFAGSPGHLPYRRFRPTPRALAHLLDVIRSAASSAVTEIDGRQRVPPVWLLLIELFRTFPDAGANT